MLIIGKCLKHVHWIAREGEVEGRKQFIIYWLKELKELDYKT